MQINKKLYTGLIITLLTLSTIAIAIPSAFALVNNLYVSDWQDNVITDGTVGQVINIGGDSAEGWSLVQFYWGTPANKIGEVYANGAGVFELENVLVPEDVAGPHDILVNDGTGYVPISFTIKPAVTLSATKALPGDSLDVAGTGFGDEVPVGIYIGTITDELNEVVDDDILDEGPVVIGTVVLDVDVTVDGDIGGTDVTGTGTITVTDNGEGDLIGTGTVAVAGGAENGEVDVTIDGAINYATGAITLSGSGVDGDAGTGTVGDIDVTIDAVAADYSWAQYDVTPSSGIATDDAGSFDDSIVVPNVPEVDYADFLVTVIDLDGNKASPDPDVLAINYYILVNPVSGPSGITVTLSGRIPANTNYEIRLDTTTIATGTSAADTTYSETHEISSFLSIDEHTFTVVWDVTEERTAKFDVTASPKMTLSATAGMAGTVITISSVTGYPFSADANLTLLLDGQVINSTADDDRFGPTIAAGPSKGLFTDIEFTVPSITPGVYLLELIDEYGASTGVANTFTVQATPETDLSLLGTEYYQGDALSFDVGTTDTITEMTITITDPSGLTWWTVVDEWIADFITIPGGEKIVPYQDQLFSGTHAVLPENAPLGSWNWTIIYDANNAGDNIKATGLFTVMERSTLDTVTADIADLVDEISDITDDVATIKTDVSNVEDLLEALDIPDFTDLTNGLASLEVSVESLDAVVTAIAGDVATVDTKVGTLEGTITGIEGDIATIQTDVGTLQADISDVKANVDNTPAWIAVVLALVAAVAAIFAVITIRQKIAG
jgi:hypothetical protein